MEAFNFDVIKYANLMNVYLNVLFLLQRLSVIKP